MSGFLADWIIISLLSFVALLQIISILSQHSVDRGLVNLTKAMRKIIEHNEET